MSPWRSGGDLALVEPLVPRRHGADPELPEVREGDVVRGEALVRRVGVPTHCQQVDVAVPDPRYLDNVRFLFIFMHVLFPLWPSNIRRLLCPLSYANIMKQMAKY